MRGVYAMIRGETRVLRSGDPLLALAAMRGRLFLFVPVLLALGAGGYLASPVEPEPSVWAGLGALALIGAALWWFGPERWQPVAAAAGLVCLGALAAGVRTHGVAEPVLGWRYYGPIEGRIVEIDRSLSDRQRLTLDDVVLARIPPARTPARVRVALHGAQGHIVPEPGMRVILTGHLMPPSGPAEPGGFDYRRLAWFQGLGAVGYTRTPVLALEPAEAGSAGLEVTRLRMRIAEAVRQRVPGQPGAFAAAILTGDRSGIDRSTTDALRGANLAHLLAISGLHMGLLTGLVFGAVRYGLALVPWIALRANTKKLAAGVALGAAGFYLMLSGGNVATQRAFVMAAVMLVAVLLDRRAISLRSVAMAATVLLLLRPDSLTQPGFQMSFAAATALVVVFSSLGAWRPEWHRVLPGWARALFGVVLCSLVAGLATAPVAAAHFNRIAEYGLLANLLTVPLMGSVVMPAAILAGVLAPVGLSQVPLAVMELGTRWILLVAHWVSGLDGALVAVPRPGAWVLPVMALGAVWLILWRGSARWAGTALIAAAVVGWGNAVRPPVLVSESGTLIGVMMPQGRALSKPRGDGFVARAWLENDGDAADLPTAHARGGFSGPDGTRRFTVGGHEVVHLTGRGARDRVAAQCREGRLIILGNELEPDAGDDVAAESVQGVRRGVALSRVARRLEPGSEDAALAGCLLIDRTLLQHTGPISLHPGRNGELVLRPAREAAGRRPWTSRD